MSCCGSPREPGGPTNRQSHQVTPFTTTTQPSPNPPLSWQEKPVGTPAMPSPPPPAHQANPYDYRQASPYHAPSPANMHPGFPGQSTSPVNGQFNGVLNGQPPPMPSEYATPRNTFGYNGPTSPPPPSTLSNHSYNAGMDVVRPMPVYHTANSTSEQGILSVQRTTTSAPSFAKGIAMADDGKMTISVDFGTTMSGVAYGSSRFAGGRVQQILNWPGSQENFRKIPTCLLYDDQGRVLAWGLEAKNLGPIPGTIRCEWFKLYLEPNSLRDGSVDPRLPPLPPGKRAIDLIIDFLSHLWEYAKEQISREIGAVADLDSADVWLTVPAAWDAAGCSMMRDAAINAGLVQSSQAYDRNWRDRLRIITEPEAAAVHCAHLTGLHQLKPSQNFMICDAGGGTVDLAVYKVLGQLQNLEIAEICARSGANCGSIFLDMRFRELVGTLLADHPAHLDPTSLANFMHAFSETDKLNYKGESDDDQMFIFTCFNPEDPDDPSVGLVNGDLAIPGNLLRREVFDPVVHQVLNLIEDQSKKVNQQIDALLLVGGFSGSDYLFKKVEERFASRIRVIARPSDADTATLRGAAQYGLARRPLVSSVIAPRSYIMKVKLPAEAEDMQKRPAYIRENDAGVPICENRLQYLVAKGAILRKGQRVKTKLCKFSATAADRTFVAVLYTSDSDRLMRYTDEGETQELCRWTVDLGTLPTFQQHANASNPSGFYTDFELGLELDSAEVRGVLLHDGQEWGRVVFDFLS